MSATNVIGATEKASLVAIHTQNQQPQQRSKAMRSLEETRKYKKALLNSIKRDASNILAIVCDDRNKYGTVGKNNMKNLRQLVASVNKSFHEMNAIENILYSSKEQQTTPAAE